MVASGTDLQKSNVAIDITKLIMAFLVVAIHTEPFGFSFWLDKGFGIFTRFCVPFFFVASSYFFFVKKSSPVRYIKRLFLLYLVWSIIYLPFDIPTLKTMSIPQILIKYLWTGNGHALWYLCGSIVGFLIVFGLSKIMSPKKLLVLSMVFLLIGCFKSTYAPVLEKLFSIQISDWLGSRNGLFYAFPYYALGRFIANNDSPCKRSLSRNIIGVIVSFFFLGLESVILVLGFHTEATILWISVLPLTYNFFMVVKSIHISLTDKQSRFIRKLSTLIYVSHCLFRYMYEGLVHLSYWKSFLAVSATATVVSIFIIVLTQKRWFRWLKILY